MADEDDGGMCIEWLLLISDQVPRKTFDCRREGWYIYRMKRRVEKLLRDINQTLLGQIFAQPSRIIIKASNS